MSDLIKRIMHWRPIRAFLHYNQKDGPVYSQAMTLSAFFSLFAALFIAFAIFMQVLGHNVELRDTLINSIAEQVPGLIQTEENDGVIDPNMLINSQVIGVLGIVAVFGIIMMALRWIDSSRKGFRAMLELPPPSMPMPLLKLNDFGVALGVGLLVLASSGILIVAQGFAETLGLGAFTQVIAVVIQFLLDVGIVLWMYKGAGHLKVPVKYLLIPAVLCAIGFGVLKVLAGLLFGGIQNNPLMASIASVFVILIWLGFINQIYLVAISLLAVEEKPASESELRAAIDGEREQILRDEKAEREKRKEQMERIQAELDARDEHMKHVKGLRKDHEKQHKKATKGLR